MARDIAHDDGMDTADYEMQRYVGCFCLLERKFRLETSRPSRIKS